MPFDPSKDVAIGVDDANESELALFQQAGLVVVPRSGESNTLWPGIRRPPNVDGRDDETASASREPWVDANGYKVRYMRAISTTTPAVLQYSPDNLGDRSTPFDSIELALIEAWTAGGTAVLALEPIYREALRRKDAKALAAWQQLGTTVRWLKENARLFQQPAVPIVTAIVDSGAASAEIANLLCRRNASPALVSVESIPTPDPERRLVVVAANLRTPSPETIERAFAHARAGASVVTTVAPTGLTATRSDAERAFYSVGKGRVVAYKRPVADPSEFALDVIDVLTHKRRAVRLWNAPAVIAFASDSPRPGERLMHLVNYGSPIDTEVQARVQGHYSRATMLRPDGSPLPLETARRGTTTEIQIPELRRLGVVIFS